MRTATRLLAAIAAASVACSTTAPSKPEPQPPAPTPRPYVFAWPFLDQPMQPRGGTTRGTDVTLATQPSPAWQRLQTPGLSARDRDRAAILAMAGDYRVSFDFLETILFTPGAKPARPYRSWATERVYVLADQPDFVSLQHILVMFVVDEQGKQQGPFVQKHWRQDWRYEPRQLLVFAGNGRFETRAVAPAERRGAWSQTVYQVDDAPRYGSLGRWVHSDEASIWEGGDAWRPLPRREHTVRSDYQVLAGRNRHTILPTGWVHEQDNLKLVLADGRTHKLAREIGVDRYEQIEGFDFAAADTYWNATSGFWTLVREGWAKRASRGRHFRLAETCNGEEGFVPFFRLAGRLEAGEAVSTDEQRAEADRALDCVVTRD
jgi:uncharacterized protein DUF6607